MVGQRERRDPAKLFLKRLMLAGLFLLMILLASGVWNIYQKEQESARFKVEAQSQLADLAQRQTQLKADITNLETDRGKEAALRQQYSMGASGEGLIVIVNPQAPVPIAATSTPFQTWLHKAFSWW